MQFAIRVAPSLSIIQMEFTFEIHDLNWFDDDNGGDSDSDGGCIIVLIFSGCLVFTFTLLLWPKWFQTNSFFFVSISIVPRFDLPKLEEGYHAIVKENDRTVIISPRIKVLNGMLLIMRLALLWLDWIKQFFFCFYQHSWVVRHRNCEQALQRYSLRGADYRSDQWRSNRHREARPQLREATLVPLHNASRFLCGSLFR